MNGKQYFQECCRELGLDCKALFQLGQQTAKRPDRLIYKCDANIRKATQMYAVCYFPEEEVYAAWDLHTDKPRGSVFSVQREEAAAAHADQILPIHKNREFSGWGEEAVLVFRAEGVKKFLNTYIQTDKECANP